MPVIYLTAQVGVKEMDSVMEQIETYLCVIVKQ